VSRRVLLEIAAGSLVSAIAAQDGGADRVELCENLGEGGCTPSFGTLAVARERLRIPLHVLIRPRGGDFVYDAAELEVMLRDIEQCVRLGCDGVVVGALDAHAQLDVATMTALRDAAGTLEVTLHRAIDLVANPLQALEVAIALRCNRVLTSGAQRDALIGAHAIAALVAQAGARIQILAGAGIDAGNVARIVQLSGVDQVHASARARRASAMRVAPTTVLAGLGADTLQTEVARVRALRQALDAPG